MITSEIQTRLKSRGFDPGPIDGVMGRKTIAAIKLFQAAKGLTADGIVGPNTAALLDDKLADEPRSTVRVTLPWMEGALRRKGLREVEDKQKLWKWLQSDGRSVGDPSQNPWCGDFVETSIALTLPNEALPTNPYLARNWLKFGRAVSPTYGAVMVFWRGSRHGSNGHVAFYVGEDSGAYHILGGNQSDAVSEMRIAKERLLGARWPLSVPIMAPTQIIKSAVGKLSTNEA